MNNYAVIIGIDEYRNQAWRLGSAVNDALRFASWAIRFGEVEPDNIKLLLSPAGGPVQDARIPETDLRLPAVEATSGSLNDVLFDNFQTQKWGQGGDRLYFYYAGHGCSHPMVRGDRDSDDPVLICSNVEKLPKQYAELISFSNVLDPLIGSGPREQFFFLDACRDFGLDGIVASTPGGGRFRPRRLEDNASQWMIYATSPGELAVETRGKGVFGEALLRGLRGDPAAPRRVAGAGNYELRFTHLYEFVRASVKEKVDRIPGAARSTQVPESVMARNQPDPLLIGFREDQIDEVELLIRLSPDAALETAWLKVLYEANLRAGPFGPGIKSAHPVKLRPAHYSIEAEAINYERKRTDPFRHPAGKSLELELSPFEPGASASAASAPYIGFTSLDPMVVIGVTGPRGLRMLGTGTVSIANPADGAYHVRIITPEGVAEEQTFEYPHRSGYITLSAPTTQIVPSQLTMLNSAGIAPSAEGYMEPSEKLGFMANTKSASLLGFAAYAAYAMESGYGSRLRSFGLGPIPHERRDEAWVSVLLNVEGESSPAFHEASSVAIYANTYRLGKFSTLAGFPAAAQYLTNTPEGNIVVELRLAGTEPTRFPLTCFKGRVATLCVNVTAAGEMEVQIYLIPFRWSEMDSETIRVVEQAQRFYAGTEPVPETMVERFLYLKSLDPLLGCVAGYELVRNGKAAVYRGTPAAHIQPGEWNPNSAMQNMLAHFGLLPDAHVLAAMCDPENAEQHFAEAAKVGVPMFTEGFRALLEHYRSQRGMLDIGMWHARRTLASGSAFSAWVGFEPALEVESGRFEKAPAGWWMLEEHRDRVEREIRAAGAVRVRAPGYETHRTGFLVARDLVLTVNHLFTPVLAPGGGADVLDATQVTFENSDTLNAADGVSATLIAIERDIRGGLALLRLGQPIPDVEPLPIAPNGHSVSRDERLYLIGYPFMQTDLDPELVKHVFGDKPGGKRVQPGYVVAAPEHRRGFDHDAFTLEGSAGSPVIDLESGFVLGVHWGGMNQSNFRRGRATALWKAENRALLRDAGIGD